MSGETNLDTLLSSMQPNVLEQDYVFCTVQNTDLASSLNMKPIATFMEEEGLTLVLEQAMADTHSLLTNLFLAVSH
ncbi:ACT domain-containing protein [Marinomonas sp. S3726]|uniref:ACT domain-containing protein n=1 Tax=Marinomonas sp. S3726 TaxID=579484 RepID=UPI000AD608F4|nr:ACT domain-containing protein [Marinomonas sp. S3726]